MKRSDLFIRLTAAVLFVAVVSYVGVLIYNTLMTSFATTEAVAYSIEETIPLQGFIIRNEEVLTDAGRSVLPVVREGERVGSGQAIAVELLNNEAIEIAAEIRELSMRIAELEALGADVAFSGFVSVRNLSQAVHSNDLSRLHELTLSIQTHVFTGGSLTPRDELPVLKNRLGVLEARNEGMRTVYAHRSGTFSQTIDGFEHISPASLTDIVPSELEELFSIPLYTEGAGKLVTHHKWYFATIIESSDLFRFVEGRRMTMHFSGVYHAEYDMLVENIGRREGNRAIVVFSSVVGIHDVAALRSLRADVVFGSISGIFIPREAVHVDDSGVVHIFLQSGARAERVNIEILHEVSDGYLVQDGAATGSPLRVGATIITKANNLYHGKVVG